MRLDLDTEIRYPDGERAGVLRRVVLGQNGQAAGVVMATTGFIAHSVIVPINLLSESPGNVLTLNLDPHKVAGLQPYSEDTMPAVPEGWTFTPNPDDSAPGADVFPATIYQPMMPVVETENLPEGDMSLSQGTEVWCLDGQWGIVDEVLLDDNSKMYAFVGRPNSTEEHDLIIPIDLISEYTPGRVTLNCTMADLPTYTQELVDEQEEPELE